MSVYLVVTQVPASKLYTTVAATPKEAEKNVADMLDDDGYTRKDVDAQATIEGLQQFAEDGKNQTSRFKLG